MTTRDTARETSVDEELYEEFRMDLDRSPGAPVARLFGELDLVSADELEGALVELAADGAEPVVVADLSALEFIDSTGLSALLVARHRIELLGSSLVIRGAGGAARRVFEAAGMEDVLDE